MQIHACVHTHRHHAHRCAHMHIFSHTCMNARAHNAPTHAYTHVRVSTYTPVPTQAHTHTRAHRPTFSHARTFTHTQVLTHVLRHTHSHMHFHTQVRTSHAHSVSWRSHCPSPEPPVKRSMQLQTTNTWHGARWGTHLEVPVDNPHLVAMENRLQDLLDAVTEANSRRVSAGGPRRVGGGAGAGGCVALGGVPSLAGGRGEAGNQGAACHMGEETLARRGPLRSLPHPQRSAQGPARPPAPPTLPSPRARPLEVLLRGDTPGPGALLPRLMLAKPGPELGALREGGPA